MICHAIGVWLPRDCQWCASSERCKDTLFESIYDIFAFSLRYASLPFVVGKHALISHALTMHDLN